MWRAFGSHALREYRRRAVAEWQRDLLDCYEAFFRARPTMRDPAHLGSRRDAGGTTEPPPAPYPCRFPLALGPHLVLSRGGRCVHVLRQSVEGLPAGEASIVVQALPGAPGACPKHPPWA